MQCIEGCLLYIPKYEIEAASGRLCRYQSMQEKLPVASSLAWIWKKEENKWITTGIKPEKYKLGMYASVVE